MTFRGVFDMKIDAFHLWLFKLLKTTKIYLKNTILYSCLKIPEYRMKNTKNHDFHENIQVMFRYNVQVPFNK